MSRDALWLVVVLAVIAGPTNFATADDAAVPDYTQDVAPLFKKYCAGCHNDGEREGDFSLESFASLQKGAGDGPVLAGDAEASRMVRVLSGGDPAMPPEGEPQPTEEEIALVRRWIDGGAKGPEGAAPDRLMLVVPAVESHTDTRPVASVDFSPLGDWLAIARHNQVILEPQGVQGDVAPHSIGSHVGAVNAVHFAGDDRLVTASGVAGLGGVAAIWNVADGQLIKEFKGHRDTLYDAELSPDGTVLATCSYDKLIILWNVETGEPLRELAGHNGAVFDVAFSPDGRFLVSASADDTCKVWRVSDGLRLDTLGQPLKEAYTCRFSPDGRFIVAGGADNRIRVWRFVSQDGPKINPPVHARFAHEGAVLRIAFTPDGSKLVSTAEDRTVKVWETDGYTELALWEDQPDIAAAVAVHPDGKRFTVGRLDGSIESYDVPDHKSTSSTDTPNEVATAPMPDVGPMQEVAETEPNDTPQTATPITLPATVTGVIHADRPAAASTVATAEGQEAEFEVLPPDVDCFRFSAKAGQEWVIETKAARDGSPLDSFVEVLDADGGRIERVLLQAVRDSYFTFRGKDASESGDFRVFNWEEMSLNQLLYADGEVVKLWMYPRGPDSGYIVYPGSGTRWNYFDTTGLSHPLGGPAYVVEPHPPGSELIPNGLPEFTLYYENDDASMRDLGKDSRLTFTAPADGDYLVKLKDVRGLDGADFTYSLSIRPRRPDFAVATALPRDILAPGSSQEFKVTATRIDGFEGPITVEVGGTLPPGFTATSPLVIEAGQIEAYGIISAADDAAAPTEDTSKASKLTASADVNGETVSHAAGTLGELKLGEKPQIKVTIVPAAGGAEPLPRAEGELLAFAIHPGETIMLKVLIERSGFDGVISFGNERSGRNLPHGAIVDNIGLNGLLLLDGQTEREFFITCDKTVEPGQSRLFHLETAATGGHTSQSVLLRVVDEDRVAEK